MTGGGGGEVAALVTRGDEEAALLGWCYTLVLLLAEGRQGGERACTRALGASYEDIPVEAMRGDRG